MVNCAHLHRSLALQDVYSDVRAVGGESHFALRVKPPPPPHATAMEAAQWTPPSGITMGMATSPHDDACWWDADVRVPTLPCSLLITASCSCALLHATSVDQGVGPMPALQQYGVL